MGGFKAPHSSGHGPGKGTFFMAEQFAFDEGSAKGGAVHGDERARGTAALLVNRARHQLLAHAGFSEQQHGCIGGSHLCEAKADRSEYGALADHPYDIVSPSDGGQRGRLVLTE